MSGIFRSMKEFPHRYEEFGVQSKHGLAKPMERVHCHTEIELNLVERGSLIYRFGSKERVFSEGQLYVFSGIEPHRVVEVESDTLLSWTTVPAAYFTGWQLPGRISEDIQLGAIVEDNDPIEFARDPVRFLRWRQDLERDDPRYIRVVLLEVRARLERLALSLGSSQPATKSRRQTNWSNPVSKMIAYILNYMTDCELDLSRIASSANLNTSYASTLFKRKVGQSPMTFLTRQRLAYAKFLLATSESKVIDAGFASGFGSSSQFYAAFKKEIGRNPSELRRNIN